VRREAAKERREGEDRSFIGFNDVPDQEFFADSAKDTKAALAS
jgi:hypothetical protein